MPICYRACIQRSLPPEMSLRNSWVGFLIEIFGNRLAEMSCKRASGLSFGIEPSLCKKVRTFFESFYGAPDCSFFRVSVRIECGFTGVAVANAAPQFNY